MPQLFCKVLKVAVSHHTSLVVVVAVVAVVVVAAVVVTAKFQNNAGKKIALVLSFKKITERTKTVLVKNLR